MEFPWEIALYFICVRIMELMYAVMLFIGGILSGLYGSTAGGGGLALGLGLAIGGWIGAGIGVKKGNKYIRILFIVILLITIGELLYN